MGRDGELQRKMKKGGGRIERVVKERIIGDVQIRKGKGRWKKNNREGKGGGRDGGGIEERRKGKERERVLSGD